MTKKLSVHRSLKSKHHRLKGGLKSRNKHVGTGNQAQVEACTRKAPNSTSKKVVNQYQDYEDRVACIKKHSRNSRILPSRKPIIAPPTFQLASKDPLTQSIDYVIEVNAKSSRRSSSRNQDGLAYNSSNIFSVLDEDHGNKTRHLQPPVIQPATFLLPEQPANISSSAKCTKD
uniref:AlNc14C255G9718 protein n=1 Tax=Albugo laibachii Nc14 TaxID=890382 RepID=F0WTP2_9STRA|nr:AlNc14C255G9718 [Albugo laibachii Nc14]|eukprot:CCA24734.1 AlNc14C255G9718 [Albugo laibachii Nc14]